jgi:hypothetical protein
VYAFNLHRRLLTIAGKTMQALALMIIYVLTAAVLQGIGFLISQIVDRQWAAASTLTFLILFLAAYGFAWPIAVRITEWLIRRCGYVVETEQSGGEGRTDHLPTRTRAQ